MSRKRKNDHEEYDEWEHDDFQEEKEAKMKWRRQSRRTKREVLTSWIDEDDE